MRIEVEITKLQAFLDSVRLVKATEKTVKAQYRSQVAEGFSPCNLFSPNEVVVSRVLAFLLNPQESHAQGRLFLDAFMTVAGSKHLIRDQGKMAHTNIPIFSEKVGVTTEHSLDQGRPDIVLTEESSILVIENKPWALDQEKQLQRYGEWIISEGKENRLLVYLCQNEPSDYTLPKNSKVESFTVHLSFNELIDALRVGNHQTKSPKVRYFVDSFCDYLQTSICQENLMENPLIVNMMKDHKNLEAYFEIQKNMPKLYQQAWNNFCQTMTTHTQKRFGSAFKLEYKTHYDDSYVSICFKNEHLNNFAICFEAQSRILNNFCWGVTFVGENNINSEEYEQIRTRLNEKLFPGRKSQTWPWWQWGTESSVVSEKYTDVPVNWFNPTVLSYMLSESDTPLSAVILDKVESIARALDLLDRENSI